jgi:hypothetical protein
MYVEKLRDLFSSTNIISSDQIKQDEMGGACDSGKRYVCKVVMEKYECKRPPGRNTLKKNGAIKINLKSRMGGCGLRPSASGYGQVTSCCEHGNEPSDSVTSGEFLSRGENCYLHRKHITP